MSQRNGLCWEMMEYEVGWVGGILGSRQEGLDLMWNCCRQPTSCTLDTVCCAKRFPRVASFNSQQSCQVAPQDAAWEVRCGLFFLVGEFWLSKCGSGWAEAVGRIRSLTWSAAEAAAAFPLSMTVCPAAFKFSLPIQLLLYFRNRPRIEGRDEQILLSRVFLVFHRLFCSYGN